MLQIKSIQSVHLPVCSASTICIRSLPHTFFLFFSSAMRYRDHTWESLCAPSSLILFRYVSTWFQRLVAGSERKLALRLRWCQRLSEVVRFFFFKPQQPIRSYIFYSWQTERKKEETVIDVEFKSYDFIPEKIKMQGKRKAFLLGCYTARLSHWSHWTEK